MLWPPEDAQNHCPAARASRHRQATSATSSPYNPQLIGFQQQAARACWGYESSARLDVGDGARGSDGKVDVQMVAAQERTLTAS